MLHTVNKSPYEKNTLRTCLRLAKPGSAILLIEDGVYAAMQGTSLSNKIESAIETHSVYVLGPDLRARGLEERNLIGGLEVIGYDGFVDLAVEQDKVQSWL